MKTSTEIGNIAKFIGEERAIELVAKCGFNAWDLSLDGKMVCYDWTSKKVVKTGHVFEGKDYLKFARKLKRIGEDCGIECYQSHAPFPMRLKEAKDSLPRAIECAAEAGAKYMVVHPENDKSARENAELFFEILPLAKACGIKIATENMWNWDKDKDCAVSAACSDEKSFLEHLELVNDEYFTACLDIGHAEMQGLNTSAVKMIYALKDKISVLHVHDNDLKHDSHWLPLEMNIDFNAVIKALKDVKFSGYMSMECIDYINKSTMENLTERVQKMADTARFLADKYENI